MRRTAAAVLVTAVTGLSAVAGTLAPASADTGPTPSAGPEAPLQVVVTQLLPRALAAHGAVEVSGYLRNVGPTPVSSISVRLRVGERVRYRGELHDADTDRPVTFTRLTERPAPAVLAPGQTVPFDLRSDADALGLDQTGVYPVDIEARGDVGDGSTEALGLAPTWIPYFTSAPRPLRVAVVWPLVDRPHQAVGSQLLDDDLATAFARSGRLGQLLAGARGAETRDCGRPARRADGKLDPAPTRCDPVPVTYAVDPDLLVAASTMTRPYKVERDGKKVAGTGTAAARAWLDSLKQGATTGDVLALPFADPDVTPLAGTAGGRDDLARAILLGRSTVTNVLGTAPVMGVAYPPPGTVSKAALDALAHGGARSFVLDTSAFGQPDSEPSSTPGARTVLATSDTADTLTGLVPDEVLSGLVTGPGTYGPRLAEQRFLAETAVIAAEAPSRTTRTLLLAPDRRGTASAAAATAALRDLGRVPWLCPVSLAAVAAGTEQCAGSPDPGPSDPREALRTDPSGQLSPDYLRGVAADRDVVGQLTDAVLSDSPDPAVSDAVAAIKERLRQAVARAESSAWRDDPAAARDSADALHSEVVGLRDRLVVRGGRALLTSAKGTLQVSVENTLPVPVQIRVLFSSNTPTLPATETGLLDVAPGHAIPAGVKALAQRSGQFVVFAQIVDRNGKPFGPDAEVIVRSTRFGRLALAVTLGGFGVLLVAAGVQVARRALRRPRDASAGP